MEFNISLKTIDGLDTIIIKPDEPLSDETYNDFKIYFESMGGHWREREKGFIFYVRLLNRNQQAQWREETQFFPTPLSVVERVTELSGLLHTSVNDCKILEPSAGRGDLLKRIPKELLNRVTAIEPNDTNLKYLMQLDCTIHKCTFEAFYDTHKTTKFTHIIMNPPFSNYRDAKHIMMAYNMLQSKGRLVAIASENSLYYKSKVCKEFKQFLNNTHATIEQVEPGVFKDSGTTIDTVIIIIDK